MSETIEVDRKKLLKIAGHLVFFVESLEEALKKDNTINIAKRKAIEYKIKKIDALLTYLDKLED